MKEPPVAITGLGAITALGLGSEVLFSGLVQGARAFREVTAFSVAGCRVGNAAVVSAPLSVQGANRTVQLAIAAVKDALKGFPFPSSCTRVGVVLGSTGVGTTLLEQTLEQGQATPEFIEQYTKVSAVDEIAEAFGFRGGPRSVVNTACSSGAVAILLASEWLRANDCDIAIAVGSDELSRFTFSGFHALRAMDPEPCRPFDRSRRGLSMGEGAACLVLERLGDATHRQAEIRGILRAVGVSCDAHHLTAPDPAGAGAARAIASALDAAELQACDLSFVNAHGTGTPLNDAAEVRSLEIGLGDGAKACPIHSVKASIGHCMGAAGAIEAVVTAQSLERGILPHTAGLTQSEFDGRVWCVKEKPIFLNAKHAISTSFGFGGNNAVVVMSRADGLEISR